jgi:flavodoxin
MTHALLHLLLLGPAMGAPEPEAACPPRVLVVYYSRSGTTARVGREIARALDAETEMIRDTRSRAGLWGWLRSGYEAWRKLKPAIRPLEKDPADYELVLLGTPVWGGTMASPMRTYLTENREGLSRVGFFCTQGGENEAGTFRDMADLCGVEPVATMPLQSDAVLRGNCDDAMNDFIEQVRASLTP